MHSSEYTSEPNSPRRLPISRSIAGNATVVKRLLQTFKPSPDRFHKSRFVHISLDDFAQTLFVDRVGLTDFVPSFDAVEVTRQLVKGMQNR